MKQKRERGVVKAVRNVFKKLRPNSFAARRFMRARRAFVKRYKTHTKEVTPFSVQWRQPIDPSSIFPGSPDAWRIARESLLAALVDELNWTAMRISSSLFCSKMYELAADDLGGSDSNALRFIDRNGEVENGISNLFSIGDKAATFANQLAVPMPPFAEKEISLNRFLDWLKKHGTTQTWLYGITTDQLIQVFTALREARYESLSEFRHALTHRLGKRADHSVGGFVMQAWETEKVHAVSFGTAGHVPFPELFQQATTSWRLTAKALGALFNLGGLPSVVEVEIGDNTPESS